MTRDHEASALLDVQDRLERMFPWLATAAVKQAVVEVTPYVDRSHPRLRSPSGRAPSPRHPRRSAPHDRPHRRWSGRRNRHLVMT